MLTGNNAALLESLYERYLQAPASVGPEWADYFRNLENGSHGTNGRPLARGPVVRSTAPGALPSVLGTTPEAAAKENAVHRLLQSYRRDGHRAARLDPLGLNKPDRTRLEPSLFGVLPQDMDLVFESGVPALGRQKLRDIIAWFEKTYCSSIGAEHFYLTTVEERDWLQRQMESTANSEPLELWQRYRLFEKVFQAETFERFLAQKFVGKKRFSLEGGESTIALLDSIAELAGELEMEHMMIGMAHRGRLTVLVNFMQKPAGVVFAEFKENYNPESIDYADVKYHLGFSGSFMTRVGRDVKLTLAFNPSHLEAVDPVVVGSVRARQHVNKDSNRAKHVPILIHGDAAFPGQGVVAETLNLGNLRGYDVGGTIHIVTNNQIGFTTYPHDSRSTRYSTDLAKGFEIPIFHVNGDDPEAVYRVAKLAMHYRHRFRKDVIIDLVCYRRLGHNETDEPGFTQPLMYEAIKKHPTTVQVYAKKLLEYSDVTQDDLTFIENGTRQGLEESFKKAKDKDVKMEVDTLKGEWAQFGSDLDSEPQTRLLREQLARVAGALTTPPEGFSVHKTLQRLIEQRREMFEGARPVDWGFAEMLAFGSILENNIGIRLAGQDAQRGTFSHRHAVFTDVNNGNTWTPLNLISENEAQIEVVNSPLSEYACLGFEYGYSLSAPKMLVLWEAQFGDFGNGAQIMIDQFITSSEVKWYRMSGLVMLLPHGYEGQGPEHSSARLERFLQLCASDNIQVCNCTTPAQYFHLLRRQILRKYRKPLVIMSPKSLLRLPEATSSMDDIGLGIFREVLHDRPGHEKKVSRVLFCSGKIYYDLEAARTERKADHVAIIRVEQLYPYPETQLAETLAMFPSAKQFYWVQEEPINMGAWFYIQDRLNAQLKGTRLVPVARTESPSPAAGLLTVHKQELAELMRKSFE